MHIAIISSSTRLARHTHSVALALNRKLSFIEGLTHDLIDLMSLEIPMFTEVLARHPQPSEGLKEASKRLHAADAIIFVSPEYNGGYSPALKNLADSLGKAEFIGKPIGVASVSTGPMGGMRGALQMQQLVLAMFGYPLPQMLLVGNVADKFDAEGEIRDVDFNKKMDTFLYDYMWFASAIVQKRLAEI